MKSHKLMIAAAAIGMGLAGAGAKPADAAAFDFTFSDTGGVDIGFLKGGGTLSFSQSPLTGVGLETAALSDLSNAAFSLSYISVVPLFNATPQFPILSVSNPSFNFENGNLIGISGVSSVPVSAADSRTFPTITTFQGSDQLSLMGAQFEEVLSGIETIFTVANPPRPPVTLGPIKTLLGQGNILFTTVDPVTPAKPVPEPLTCAGTAVAGGIGWLMKRQARSQKAKA